MKKAAFGWLLSRASAVVLVAGLAVHFSANHFGRPNASEHGIVMMRLAHPGWMAFYAVFLLAIIYHAAYGLWGIALEYLKKGRVLSAVKSALVILSALLVIAGLWILSDTQMLLANPPAPCYKCHSAGSTAGTIPSGRALRIFQ
ncbi:MAG: hypothetical protein M0Z52_04935 [Actinomycetota bacterium]|nr:hypothetical protein [Actinomycetota bacterium]